MATYTDPPTFTAGVSHWTAAYQNTYIRDNLGAAFTWQSYTPILTQSSAVTKTVTHAQYRSAGKTAWVIVKLAVTAAGTANNTITVSLPSGLIAATTGLVLAGQGTVVDNGTNNYPCGIYLESTTTVSFFRQDAPPAGTFGSATQVGKDPNFALANGDSVYAAFDYPLA